MSILAGLAVTVKAHRGNGVSRGDALVGALSLAGASSRLAEELAVSVSLRFCKQG
jgi:hypothetical protein